VTRTHHLPVDITTYNFTHLSVQEILCAAIMSTLSEQEQWYALSKHFDDYPNVFIFLCGLTRLLSPTTSQFIFGKLMSSSNYVTKNDVLTALRCVHECESVDLSQSAIPFELNLRGQTLQPFDCLCVGQVLSCYSVYKVNMTFCHIGDTGAQMLINKSTRGFVLQSLDLTDNDLTVVGVNHVIKIVAKS